MTQVRHFMVCPLTDGLPDVDETIGYRYDDAAEALSHAEQATSDSTSGATFIAYELLPIDDDQKVVRILTSKQFTEALTAAGVIRREDLVNRVVIDAQVGSIVTIYVDRVGDDRLLNVARTLEGIEISRSDTASP